MSVKVFLCLLMSVACAAAGQILLRFGAAGRTDFAGFLNPWLFGGLAFYGLGTVLWVLVISRASLTLAYPFTALTVGVVYVAAVMFLGETATRGMMIGVSLIVLGLVVIWAYAPR